MSEFCRALGRKRELWEWRWRSSSGYTMVPFGASCWGSLTLKVIWEPRDLWIGVYRERVIFGGARWGVRLYICVLPCLPIRLDVSVYRWETVKARWAKGYGLIGRASG